MKKLLILLTITTTFISCCKKDIMPTPEPTPLSQLPPATQTGANTFGCLLDGQVFKPGFYNNSYQCFYQLVNGGYYFNVNANYRMGGVLKSIGINTEKLQITEGQTLKLYERLDGNAFATYSIGNSNTGVIEDSETTITNTGELKITKLDLIKDIVSGTFWFDVKDKNGVVHQVREGRFDMLFTR
jgi:hypothetical protein